MEILKFDNAATPRRKKNNNLKSLAGLASVAAIAVLGSTLAANISLGSASGIEFGQGVQVTSACDEDGITVVPTTRFMNAANAGTFYLSTIALSGINFSSSACQGKLFTLNAYNNTDATPLQLATSSISSSVGITSATFANSTGTTYVGTAGIGVSGSGGGTTSGGITLGFGTPSSTSGAVYKITLQSSGS